MKKIAMALTMLALSAACGIPVSAECQAARALTDDDCPGGTSLGETFSDEGTYGDGGTCWTNAQTADSCTQACQAALDSCGGGEGEGEA